MGRIIRGLGRFCLLTVVCVLTAAATEPYRPQVDSEVLAVLPDPASPDAQALRRLRAELAARPDDQALAVDFARRNLELARRESDPRYLGYAEAALLPWLASEPAAPDVLMLRARLRQSRHDFAGALADLDQVIARRPTNPQAWFSKAVILQLRGDNVAAGDACQPLARLTSRLAALACLASAASRSGQARRSYVVLRQALAADPGADDGLRLWVETLLAEIASQLDDVEAAAEHFARALAVPERDVYLLTVYADFLLDQGRPAEVVRLLENETRIDGLLLRLAIAETRLGRGALAAHKAELHSRIAESRLRNDLRHLRIESRFALELEGDAAAALALAQMNWEQQREPEDARLLLAAARAAGDDDAARPVLEWIARSGLEDERLRALAGPLR